MTCIMNRNPPASPIPSEYLYTSWKQSIVTFSFSANSEQFLRGVVSIGVLLFVCRGKQSKWGSHPKNTLLVKVFQKRMKLTRTRDIKIMKKYCNTEFHCCSKHCVCVADLVWFIFLDRVDRVIKLQQKVLICSYNNISNTIS